MLIQIHMLQNYAPSNLNRDDSGSPKDAVFGGVRRGRISSQCLKRSIRRSSVFVDAFGDDGLLASRTRLLPKLIAAELEAMAVAPEDIAAIVQRVPEIGRESTKPTGAQATDEEPPETRQLIFVAPNEVRPLAEALLEQYRDAGKAWARTKIDRITGALQNTMPRSVDVAMFGRMTTSAAFEDVEAAVQVAHALSTNALTQEFDYFTAVDDLSGESGAGMIGDVEFNSSTYYKYLNVHWEGLLANLGGDVAVSRRAVLALVTAAAVAQPSGKQNSFAAHNLPDLIVLEVREQNLPVSYANAFLQPIRQGPNGIPSLMESSIKALMDYAGRMRRMYDLNGDERAAACSLDLELPDLTVCPSLSALTDWLGERLPG
ncbi:MAG TPA: type I-E CRISPR-associated protein Cas7/Cse4/CasC [Chloroflexi bacterium]|jgi:CRISPR system Cascade subunit CasC|nr:type I-E CRISPR-associated protein Cas7/Cse4/CasC [Chloroflexota bacterium]